MRTSRTDPLRIDPVDAPGGGRVGLTFCPGKRQPDASTGPWDRDLDLDLDAICGFGATALVTLMETDELRETVRVPPEALEEGSSLRGIEWFHLPIVDMRVPDEAFERLWLLAGPRLRRRLREGESVVVHCRGGIGRTCTIAGRLLAELGTEPETALELVKEARPSEWYPMTRGQEAHVLSARRLPPGPTLRDRIVGSLVAGAAGDALGAPVEFLSMAEIRSRFGPEGIREYAPAFGIEPSAITDDTQMTMFTAEGLIRGLLHREGPTPEELARSVWEAYGRWLRTQTESRDPSRDPDGWLLGVPGLWSRRAPGNTCMGSLVSGRMGTPEEPQNGSAGCGGIMRVAPVGLAAPLLGDFDRVFSVGERTAASTHGHPAGYLPAGYQAAAIAALLGGADLEAALAEADRLLASRDGREAVEPILARAARLFDAGDPTPETLEELGGAWTGEEALAISVLSARAAKDVESGLILAVNHGGDTDSTGAITGNLLGARDGAAAIPSRLWQPLELLEPLLDLARDLADLVEGSLTPEDPDVRRRYPAGGCPPG